MIKSDSVKILKIKNSLQEHIQVVDDILKNELLKIHDACHAVYTALQNGGKIVFVGNGGSAADSQHLAAEFVGRFVKNRKPLPAIALTTDTSIITAIGNDFGFEQIFERQVAALCKEQDILVCISTSGNSLNVIKAVETARQMNVRTIGLLGGEGGKLKTLVDIPIVVSSTTTARVQEAHILVGHIICEFCDE